ncbi:hypothetical protein ACJX0J_036190, partial [Zea mays]
MFIMPSVHFYSLIVSLAAFATLDITRSGIKFLLVGNIIHAFFFYIIYIGLYFLFQYTHAIAFNGYTILRSLLPQQYMFINNINICMNAIWFLFRGGGGGGGGGGGNWGVGV